MSGDAHVHMLSKELEESREETMTLTMAILRVLELMFNKAREPSLSELKTEAMPLLSLVNATELMPEVAPVAQESNPTYTVIPGMEPHAQEGMIQSAETSESHSGNISSLLLLGIEKCTLESV